MKSPERLAALKKLIKEHERNPNVLRPTQSRLRWLGQAVPLLNFNPVLHENAMSAADILARPNFSSNMYEQMEGRILLIVQQGITELEHDLTPQLGATAPEHSGTHGSAISFAGSTIGILNTGVFQNTGNLAVSVDKLAASGQPELAEALKRLAEAITTSGELTPGSRADALEQLDELGRQAISSPEKRAKISVIRAVFQSLATTLSAAGGLAEVWSTWGTTIRKFFGL